MHKHKIFSPSNWKQLTRGERANLIRTLVDVGPLILLTILTKMLLGAWGDDDDDWDKNMRLSALLRLNSQVSALALSPGMIEDNWKILGSPAAAVNWFENVSQLGIRVARPWK